MTYSANNNEPGTLYQLYLNVDTGEWGDRASLALVTMTSSQVAELAGMTPEDRREAWQGATRYFGDVPVARGTRRHLTVADQDTGIRESDSEAL